MKGVIMKKISNLFIALTIYSFSSIICYDHVIENKTKYRIIARCWSDVGQKGGDVTIQPDTIGTVNVGLYCIHTVTVRFPQGEGIPEGAETEIKISPLERCKGHRYTVYHNDHYFDWDNSTDYFRQPMVPIPKGIAIKRID